MASSPQPNAPKDNPFMPDTSKPAEPIYRPFPERPAPEPEKPAPSK